MRRVGAGAAIAAALAVTSCSGSDDPPEPPTSAPEASTTEAATLCTEIVNEAVVGPDLLSPDDVYVEVLGAFAREQEPPAASRARWAGQLTDHLGAAAATKERLAAWTDLASSYDGAVEVLSARADALAEGSWVQVRVAFGERIDQPVVGEGDCAVVFTPHLVQPPKQWRHFTADAATICTEILNRRAATYADDLDRVALAEAQVAAGDEVSSPDDVDAALGRIAAEWRSTADDFAAIDPGDSPSPEAWDRLGELAAERVAVAEQRRAAIATSNDAAMAAAFAEPDYRLKNFGFALLLLEGRSCGGLTA